VNIFLLKYRYYISFILGGLFLSAVYFLTQENQPLPEYLPEKIILSPAERNWVKKNPIISVGVDLDFAPIEDLDKNNQYIGVTADFLALAEKKTGLRFNIDRNHSWEKSIKRIKAGKIHMLGAAVPSEQRKKFLNFSQPYAWLSGVIIVRKNVTEPMSLKKLTGMQVMVVHNYIWKDILEISHPELDISPAPNIETALKKVSFGMADAMVGYMATAAHHIERLGISNLKISGETVSVLDICFAVNKETPHLRNILNQVLEQTPEARKKTILRKWISLELRPIRDLKYFTRIVFPGVILGLLVLIGIIIWNRSLQRQVNQRTEKLNQELTQRTLMELALRESEEKYRSIFGNIQDVYFEIMPQGQVLEISPSIKKVIGYSRTMMMKKSLSHFFVNPDDFLAMSTKVITEGILEDHEVLLAHPNKEPINCSMNAMLIRNRQGAPGKIIGSIRNITDRVKAQSALKTAYHELEKRVEERTAELRKTNQELNKAKETADAGTLAKSSFLANMSHEIRTPLSGVISASELVLNESLPEKTARYIKLIHTSGHALLGVIDDILDFSKIEAGKLDMETHPFHLDQVIERVAELFKPKIIEKKIQFVTQVQQDTPHHVLGDSFRLQQILTNLVSNAIKFTDKGGQITLGVSGTNGDTAAGPIPISFWVADTGIGIAPEHQDLLFTPFSQIDASTTRKYGGSGLGLSICGQLVEMMGGTITVKSRPRQGSQFFFTIPLEQYTQKQTDQPALAPLGKGPLPISTYRTLLKGRRVLVAEDTPTNQEITLAVLELAGIETLLVDTGTKAVAAIQNQRFDAVLMDIQMPEMDGLEATRTIRRQQGKDLPIIAMTARTLKEDQAKCMAAGMNGYISKPVSQEKLFNTLIALIHHHPVLPSVKEKTPLDKCPGQVPGIEIKKTITSLGVGVDVFMGILHTFFKNHEQTIDKINTAWQARDQKDVITLVHSLKGSAAGIGATTLHDLVRDLEKICRKETSLPSLEKAGLPAIKTSLEIVLTSIKTLGVQKNPMTTRPLIQADPAAAMAILGKLEKSLAFPELKELEALMASLASVLDHPLLSELKTHIASYDHDLAKKSVTKLKSLLETKTP
jgi:PAS domain S-box-containing protein